MENKYPPSVDAEHYYYSTNATHSFFSPFISMQRNTNTNNNVVAKNTTFTTSTVIILHLGKAELTSFSCKYNTRY